jgi:hypothetical protein
MVRMAFFIKELQNMFKCRQAVIFALLVCFFGASIQMPAFAQIDPLPFMPQPGAMVAISPEYTPAYLKGIVVHPENPLKFDFIIYKGDKALSNLQKREEYTKLTKYFLASLAIPDENQWVNLSPYEKDRIIKDDFGKTEMGRDLLAQDYLLKQITASLINPQDSLGRKFWDKVYAEARKRYGTTNVPINTFNKVWILPDDALIYEESNENKPGIDKQGSGNITAYVLKNHLRVMLEEDYLSLQKHSAVSVIARSEATKQSFSTVNTLGSQIIKQIVLPELEREVNEDANFAPLRQVYSGMLLATWFKHTLKQSLLGQIYANKAKVRGIDQDPRTNEMIYQQYLKAYRKGVFNFIKEDNNIYTNETIPRKYFSGGAVGAMAYDKGAMHLTRVMDAAQLAQKDREFAQKVYDDATVVLSETKHDAAMRVPRSLRYAGAAVILPIAALAALSLGHHQPVQTAQDMPTAWAYEDVDVLSARIMDQKKIEDRTKSIKSSYPTLPFALSSQHRKDNDDDVLIVATDTHTETVENVISFIFDGERLLVFHLDAFDDSPRIAAFDKELSGISFADLEQKPEVLKELDIKPEEAKKYQAFIDASIRSQNHEILNVRQIAERIGKIPAVDLPSTIALKSSPNGLEVWSGNKFNFTSRYPVGFASHNGILYVAEFLPNDAKNKIVVKRFSPAPVILKGDEPELTPDLKIELNIAESKSAGSPASVHNRLSAQWVDQMEKELGVEPMKAEGIDNFVKSIPAGIFEFKTGEGALDVREMGDGKYRHKDFILKLYYDGTSKKFYVFYLDPENQLPRIDVFENGEFYSLLISYLPDDVKIGLGITPSSGIEPKAMRLYYAQIKKMMSLNGSLEDRIMKKDLTEKLEWINIDSGILKSQASGQVSFVQNGKTFNKDNVIGIASRQVYGVAFDETVHAEVPKKQRDAVYVLYLDKSKDNAPVLIEVFKNEGEDKTHVREISLLNDNPDGDKTLGDELGIGLPSLTDPYLDVIGSSEVEAIKFNPDLENLDWVNFKDGGKGVVTVTYKGLPYTIKYPLKYVVEKKQIDGKAVHRVYVVALAGNPNMRKVYVFPDDPNEKFPRLLGPDNLSDEVNAEGIDGLKARLGLDFAMIGPALKPDPAVLATPGGIDLNSANLRLIIKRDGHGAALPLDQQDLAQLSHIEGLNPIIVSIAPATQAALFPQTAS